MMAAIAALGGLFLAAFGAATILPFQSEVVFVGLQLGGRWPVWLLVLVASIGNILGAVVNFVMGLYAERFRDRRWFPASGRQLDRAQDWWQRYGLWTLLLSWAPFGDAFTVIAGIMRVPLWQFLALVSVAKTGRYIVLTWATAAAAG
ncbi:membrane protein YqaA, SNARE-associated domain [Roseivivax halotolerans]|uniref:Membrane protein YqaA, SNARE-associated domain n=1 Tax=Roseivivax halotolerans TaxID=93684 RepID=A0A1I5YL31_9RHOB|nr:YqaA family protein [Roseivivax halotolerans]SFQ44872.1 membrane protein YqaA, SNARE-associated domain [Roseivivax halotolerans]